MKLKVFTRTKTEKGTQDLPKQFSEPVRRDLIKRAVHALRSKSRQAYGADPRAGKKASAVLSRRRRNYRGAYGHGISRVPRKIMTRRGMHMNWVGAFAPGTVGGRRAHPPTSEKKLAQKINDKERRKAIRSALAASVKRNLVELKHRIPEDYPFLLSKDVETLSTTKDVRASLRALGLGSELERVAEKKVRAGRGKARGRKYKRKTGPLIVVSIECNLLRAAKNMAGVDVVPVDALNAEILAPGAEPGRLVMFTEQALEILEKNKLYE